MPLEAFLATAILVAQRIALNYTSAWASFAYAHVELGIYVVQLLAVTVHAIDRSCRFDRLLLLNGAALFANRVFFLALRIYGESRRGLSASTECRWGWFLNALAICVHAEVIFVSATTGCYASIILGILLCLPGITMPRGETFYLEYNGYFYGTTWPYIVAAILWRMSYDAIHLTSGIHGSSGMVTGSLEIFLARMADYASDILVACTFHPAKWLHARVLSEGLNFTFLYISDRHPLMQETTEVLELSRSDKFWLDVIPCSLGFCCLVVHIYASRWGSRRARSALLRPFSSSLYADRYRPGGGRRSRSSTSRKSTCATGSDDSARGPRVAAVAEANDAAPPLSAAAAGGEV